MKSVYLAQFLIVIYHNIEYIAPHCALTVANISQIYTQALQLTLKCFPIVAYLATRPTG